MHMGIKCELGWSEDNVAESFPASMRVLGLECRPSGFCSEFLCPLSHRPS